jgi:hypothetical protein
MADFKITAPNGKAFIITAPDNASDADVQAYAQQQFAQMATDAGKPKTDPADDFSGDSTGMLVLKNLGAGLRQVGEGAGQRLGLYNPSDEEITRQRAHDKALADAVTGGGILQGVGSAAPLLPLMAIPGLNAGIGGALASGALQGGLGGALQTTKTGESALSNAALGAGAGAALGGVGAWGVGKLASMLPKGGAAAAAGDIGNALAGKGASAAQVRAAAQQAAQDLAARGVPMAGDAAAAPAAASVGPKVATILRDWELAPMEGVAPKVAGFAGGAGADAGAAAGAGMGADLGGMAGGAGADAGALAQAGDVPQTVAAMLRNNDLAQIESGLRAKQPGVFADLDKQTQAGVANLFNQLTEGASPDAIKAAQGVRTQAWTDAWNNIKPTVDDGAIQKGWANLKQLAEQLPDHDLAGNSEAKTVFTDFANRIDAKTMTAEKLQNIRASLNADYGADGPMALKAKAIINDQIDNVLNDATNGRWSNEVLQPFADASAPINEAMQRSKIYGQYFNDQGVLHLANGANPDLPNLTLQNYQRALSKATKGKQGALSSDAQAISDQLQDVLRGQDMQRQIKLAGTGGGGSQTAMQTAAGNVSDAVGEGLGNILSGFVPGAGYVRGALGSAAKLSDFTRQRALAQAMADPAKMQQILAQLSTGPTGMQQAGQAVADALRRGISSNAGAAMAQRG